MVLAKKFVRLTGPSQRCPGFAHWKTGLWLLQNRPNVVKPQVSESYIQNFEMQFTSVRNMAMIEKSFFRERFSPEVVAQFTECGRDVPHGNRQFPWPGEARPWSRSVWATSNGYLYFYSFQLVAMEASHRACVTPQYVLKVAVAACWFRSTFVCVCCLKSACAPLKKPMCILR